MAGTVCGNVYHDCHIDEPGGFDLHGGIGLDNLLDAVQGGVSHGGGSDSAVPPRHAAGLVMWNWATGNYDPYKPHRRVPRVATWREMPGFIAVGVHGRDGHEPTYVGPGGPFSGECRQDWAWVESPNQAVRPASLYLHQRELSGKAAGAVR